MRFTCHQPVDISFICQSTTLSHSSALLLVVRPSIVRCLNAVVLSARRRRAAPPLGASHARLSVPESLPSFFSNCSDYRLKEPARGRQAGQAVGMVDGRLMALAVVEVDGPGRGGEARRSWRRWRWPRSPKLRR
jgi:hypothetical protein